MSKQRKSFIVHYDSLNVLDDLTDDQAGLLFKAIKAYHLNDDIELDALTNIAMSPFRNQFERDADKYEKLCEKNRLIAESRYSTKSTTGKSGNHTLPQATKSTDNDSKNDSDSKSDNKVTSDRFAEFWNLYSKKVDTAKCKAKFSKLTNNEIDLIFKNLPAYVNSKPDKQYRKNPITWLNGKCWNDDVELNHERTQEHNPKLSAYERTKQRNDAKYRDRSNECGLVVGADDRHLGGAVDEGEGGVTIEHVDNGTFIDY